MIYLFIQKFLKGAFSGLRQFLPTENPFKNDEKCFLFLFVHHI